MRTTISTNFKTTIPKKIRKALDLHEKDTLEWRVENDKIVLTPIKNKFDIMALKGIVNIPPGDVKTDIELARKMIANEAISD